MSIFFCWAAESQQLLGANSSSCELVPVRRSGHADGPTRARASLPCSAAAGASNEPSVAALFYINNEGTCSDRCSEEIERDREKEKETEMGPCYCGVLIATRRGQPHTTDDGLSSVLPLIPANQLLVSQELKTKERENRWQSRQPIRRLISAIRPPKRTRPACHSSVTRGKWINGNLNVGMWDADRMRCISIQPPTSTRICMHNDIQHLHSNHAGYRYFIMHSVAGDFSFLQLRRVHKKKKEKKNGIHQREGITVSARYQSLCLFRMQISLGSLAYSQPPRGRGEERERLELLIDSHPTHKTDAFNLLFS